VQQAAAGTLRNLAANSANQVTIAAAGAIGYLELLAASAGTPLHCSKR
jgi:hypothetical protein